MKELLLLLAFIAMATAVMAQDVIITKESERIEAQITEITDEAVKYKRFDNLDGPVFVLSAPKVASIVFANGEVFVFREQPQRSVADDDTFKTEDRITSQLVETLQISENQIINSQETIVSYIDLDKLYEMGGEGKIGFYIGGQKLSDNEYKVLTKETCPEAYRIFKKAKTIENVCGITGTCLLVGGIAMAAIPGIEYLQGKEFDKRGKILLYSGIGLFGSSMLFVLATVGKPQRLKSESARIFNQQCGNKKVTSSLSIGLTPNGAGLVLNF